MLWFFLITLVGGLLFAFAAGKRRDKGKQAVPNAAVWAAAVVLLILAGLARSGGGWTGGFSFVGRQQDYYNLLVEGFVHGHLYLPVTPDPGLFSTDPLTRHLAPFLLDAGLYHDRYYLYYGVVPAALILLPYRILTGANLSLNVVTLLCCATGFAWALATFESARRRYFPRLGGISQALLVLVLGLGTGTTFLVRRSMFYEVPAAAGYACAMAAAFFLFRACVETRRSTSAVAWASACLGLAVGCRPNYVFALPAVAVVAGWRWRQRFLSGEAQDGRVFRGLLAASLGPAALVGAALASYNWARFGSPWDFGFRHGMNSFFETAQSLFSVARIPWNLRWYYLSAPSLSPYFPFVYPINGSFGPDGDGGEAMHGEAVFILFLVALATGYVLTRRVRTRLPRPWVTAMAWMIVPSLIFTFLLKIRANRYVVDFQASAVLMTVLGASAVLVAVDDLGRRIACAIRVMLGTSCALIIVFNVLAALQQFDGFRYTYPETFAWLTRVSSFPASWLRRATDLKPGPVELQVEFDGPPQQARLEPLLTTGLPHYSDSVYAIRYPDNRVELTVDHIGYGWPHGRVFPVEPGRKYTIRVEMGSLYPPAEDPYFEKWNSTQVAIAKTTARITLDGATALNTRMRFYEAPPWSLTPGKNHTTYTGFGRDFSGRIVSFRRLGGDSASSFDPNPRSDGYWDLNLKFDRASPGVSEPLLASGLTGSGNLIFVEVLASGKVRFGCDFWGFYAARSEALSFPLEMTHHVELFVGPLVASWPWPSDWKLDPKALEAQRDSFRVWVDGHLVWSLLLDHHLDSYDVTELGTNTPGFDTAIGAYSGPLEQRDSTAQESLDFIRKNLALPGGNVPSGNGVQ
jgi:hypothetical protein